MRHGRADGQARAVDNHQVVVVGHGLNRNQVAGLLRDVNRLHALAAAVGDAVLLQVGALAVAVLAQHEHVLLRVGLDANHADHLVALLERNAAHAGAHTSDGTHRRLVEANRLAAAGRNHDFGAAARELRLEQLVALADDNRVDAVLTRTRVGLELRLLDDALFRAHDDVVAVHVVGIVQTLDVDVGAHLVVGLNLDDVLDGAALRAARALGNLVDLEPVAAALLREEEHRVVHRGRIDVLDEVLVARGAPLGTPAAAVLRTVLGQRRALDVAHVRDGDDHVVVGVEVLGVELLRGVDNLRAALVAVLLLDLEQLLLDNLELHADVGQHLLQVGNLLFELVALGHQLAVLEPREGAQTHLDDGRSLDVAQPEALNHRLLGGVGGLRRADDVDNLVDVVLGDEQTQHDVEALLGLAQLEARAAHHHVVAVVDEVLDQVAQVEQLRAAVDQRDVVHREDRLQRRILVERVEHDARHGIVLQNHDDAQSVAVRLVVDVGDALNLLLVNHVGDFLNHLRLVDHVGNLRDDDALAAAGRMLDFGAGAHDHPTAAREQRLAHALVAVDDASRREVGGLDVFEQLLALDVGVVDIGAAGVDHLAQVVRGHVGRHADGNTARAVDQQQRNLRGEDRGFGNRIVEVERPVDRLLVDVGHHLVGDFLHAGLGVTHGGRRVAVHRAEVALAVHERVAHRPVLSQTHHGVVDRRVAVGVELTEHVADDTRRLTRRLVRIEIQLGAHVVEDTAMHGLQTVPHIGKRTRHDDRHRIVDVRRLHLLFDIDRNDTSCQTCILFFFS